MGVFAGPKEPSVDLSLNANNSVTVTIKNIPASEYRIKVDGFSGITTFSSGNSAVGVLTVSPGLTRNITVESYENNVLNFTASKYVKIFDYVGTSSTVGWAQTWTVPTDVRYLFADVQGAQGGDSGGLGGRAKSYIGVTGGETLQFYCGGAGQNSTSVGCTSIDPGFRTGGFNGGGDSGGKSDAYLCPGGQTTYSRGASGGGASDIRRVANDLSSRIIVAGGGGGSYGGGGAGGGENGVDGGFSIGGPWTSSVRGTGATITGPGIGGTSAAGVSYYGKDGLLGIGGTGARFVQFGDAGGTAAGGGGGYFGGGGGGAGSNYGAGGGGGGGSGYIDPLTKSLVTSNQLGTISSGYRSGNGRILISWASPLSYSDIVTSGLVLNLDAQNYYSYPGSGTTWTDLSGNGNTGTLTNGPTYSSANGGSIVFDGTDDHILVASNAASIPYGSSARTVSIWFYTNSTTWTDNANNLFFYGSGSTGGAFGIDFSAYPSMEVYTWGSGTNDITFNTTYSQVGWKNISVTYNGATTILIYENGVFTQTFALPSVRNTTISDVYIGAINPSALAGGYYDGRIATTQIYNRALTAAEIQQNFNALRGRFGI